MVLQWPHMIEPSNMVMAPGGMAVNTRNRSIPPVVENSQRRSRLLAISVDDDTLLIEDGSVMMVARLVRNSYYILPSVHP